MKQHAIKLDRAAKKRFDCLLVNPPLCSCGCYEKTVKPMVPTQLLSLATALRRAGFQANVLDLAILQDARETFREVISELEPAAVGFSNHTVINLDVIEQLAQDAKECGAKVLIGGVNATNMHEAEMFHTIPSADHIFKGFSEEAIVSFFANGDVGKVIGSKGDEFYGYPDIGMLPYIEEYTDGLYPIETQRGCRHHCTFCTSRMGLKDVISRPVGLVVGEVKIALGRGFREFFITDNTFTGDRKHAMGLCGRMIEEKLDARFIAMTRLDCVDLELLRCMSSAGVRSLGFGFESMSPETLSFHKKGLNHMKTYKALAQAKECGIETTAFVIAGIPWEGGEAKKATYDAISHLMQEGVLDFVTVSMFRPFPGTPFWDRARWVREYLWEYENGPDSIFFEKSVEALHDWGYYNRKGVKGLVGPFEDPWAISLDGLNPKKPEFEI